MNRISLAVLNFYQIYLSHIFGGNCRFYPSCSDYAKESFGKHRFFPALWLTTKRVCKCHPLGPQGYDPVPSAKGTICMNQVEDPSS